MSMSKAKEKIIRYNVKTRAIYQIYSEESQERTLKTLSRSRLLEKDNIEISINSGYRTIEEQEEFSGINKSTSIHDNTVLGKIFCYFFDN